MNNRMLRMLALSLVMVGLPALSIAGPITGESLNFTNGNPTGIWNPGSTNAGNYANADGGYVLFVNATPTSVTLDFYNTFATTNTNWRAWYEVRIDEIAVEWAATHYNTSINDIVYPYFSVGPPAVPSPGYPVIPTVVRTTFVAGNMVEIRSAFGPEGDWRFDWTAFKVAEPLSTPDGGATVLLLGAALAALGVIRRRLK